MEPAERRNINNFLSIYNMKIVYCIDFIYTFGGVEIVTILKANALAKIDGHREVQKSEELSWDEGLRAAYHTGNPYVQKALKRIEEGFQGRLSGEAIAEELGVSFSYLSRKLKEETGLTFGGLLTQYRLQQAIEMLQAGTWRVYEVAEQTGFGDYKNFTQAFKKYLHTTPKAFMQEITVGIKL